MQSSISATHLLAKSIEVAERVDAHNADEM
jgi:hypothetical protein